MTMIALSLHQELAELRRAGAAVKVKTAKRIFHTKARCTETG